MLYDIAHFWAALLVAVLLGVGVGWFTLSDEPRHGPILRVGRGWIFWSAILFLVGLVLAFIHALPDRPGLWLETALLLFVGYVVGCPIPGLRSAANVGRRSAAADTSGAVPPSPTAAGRVSTLPEGSFGKADSLSEAGASAMPAVAPTPSVAPAETRPAVGPADGALRSSAMPSETPAAAGDIVRPPPVFRPVGADGEAGTRGPAAEAAGASPMSSDLPAPPGGTLRPAIAPPAVGPTDHQAATDRGDPTDGTQPPGNAERPTLVPPVPTVPVGVRPVRKRAVIGAAEKAVGAGASVPSAPSTKPRRDGRPPDILPDAGAPVDDAATAKGDRGPVDGIDTPSPQPTVSPLASIGVRPTRKRAAAGVTDPQDTTAPTGTATPIDKAGRNPKTPSKPRGRAKGVISDDPDAVDKPKS